MTGANVGSPGNSTELSQHETQISNITYYNNCCPPVIPPVIFQTTECCRKAHFGGAILSPFFFVNCRKAIFDVVTGSPIFSFIRRMSPKKLFLHKTSSPFFCEPPKNLEISRLRRQSLNVNVGFASWVNLTGGFFVVLLVPLFFESGGAVRILSVGVVRRKTFLDIVSIDDTFRRFTSRFIVCFVGDSP